LNILAHWHSQEQTEEFKLGSWRDYPCDSSNQNIEKKQSQHAYACTYPYTPGISSDPPNPHNCPPGWVPFRDSCYFYGGVEGGNTQNHKSWQEAQQGCENMKDKFPVFANASVGLAVIWGAYDNAFIHSMFGSDQANRIGHKAIEAWVGLQVKADNVTTHGDAYSYHWWDGSEMVYSNWGDREPQADTVHLPSGQGCIALSAPSGHWRVVENNSRAGHGCNTAFPYICEAKMDYEKPSDDDNDPRGALLNCTKYHEHTFGEY